ncbi:MAG: response regulator [Anaerolineae bacterium]|nr:response regulator [Anaerolineae bacterium]
MKKKFSGAPIARYQVFTLADGAYAVQWDERRVQDLLTGSYREFDPRRDFGHPISEYELKQLKAAGCVEYFNRDYVWLMPLPENGRYGVRKEMGRGDRIRAYYLSTSLLKTRLEEIQGTLVRLGIASQVHVIPRQNILVIMARDGSHFRTIQEAEKVQSALQLRDAELFASLTVAFDEISVRVPSVGTSTVEKTSEPISLDELIASQRDTSVTAGRQVVMAIKEEEEREAYHHLFDIMEIQVQQAETGGKALELLEDHETDLLLMDLLLPDMHGWQMIGKIKEIENLRDLPVMIITDEHDIGMTIAKVDYLTRPVSIARLRHNIWKILSERVRNPRPSSR